MIYGSYLLLFAFLCAIVVMRKHAESRGRTTPRKGVLVAPVHDFADRRLNAFCTLLGFAWPAMAVVMVATITTYVAADVPKWVAGVTVYGFLITLYLRVLTFQYGYSYADLADRDSETAAAS
jgi:hypothetical protein